MNSILLKAIAIGSIFLFYCLGFLCQTGPAGIDNSTNNALWLKADAGTSTTTNGSPISSWSDVSGNGNTVSQGTANQQPLFQTSVMNGNPAILFDNNNGSGQNDYLSGADSPVLDNSDGFSLFTVVRALHNNNNARSIVSKRTNVGVNQAYMLFLYNNNRLTLDVVTNNNRFDSNPTSIASGSNYILTGTFDGTLASSQRSKLYSGQTLLATGTETSTTMPDYNSPLIIGATHVGDPRPFDGYISEIIYFRRILNSTEKIIVDNYLSSKYNISLSSNDYYSGDSPVNGDFDREVAGIGQTLATDSHDSFSPSVSGGLGVSHNSGFDNGDYLFVGHNLLNNGANFIDINVTPFAPVDMRWERIWYIDVTNKSVDLNTSLTFDISDGGMGNGITAGNASDYKLLYRSVNSGNWTIVATASSVAGDQIVFDYSFIDDLNDGYYTIGTINYVSSPLPVELVSFDAIPDGKVVNLYWTTSSEQNSSHFLIEKSRDGTTWNEVETISAAGNSTTFIDYFTIDNDPYQGKSYYKLTQFDQNGSSKEYPTVTVYFNGLTDDAALVLFPNPTTKDNISIGLANFKDKEVLVVLRDVSGREFYSKVIIVETNDQIIAIDPHYQLASGTYLITASSNDAFYSEKLIIK